ncbi:MAG TPA: SLATT domain-containing protein [Rhodopila sp.]
MAFDDIRQSVEDQLQKLEDDTDLTSASDFSMAQRWEGINIRLGLCIVLASGVVTVIGATASIDDLRNFQRYFTLGSTILASLATVVASVLTFLKPSERGERYREFGNKQKALRNRIRIYRAVVMKQDPSVERLTEQLVAFGLEKDTLNSDNPPIPHSAFRRAAKEMLAKRRRRAKLDTP